MPRADSGMPDRAALAHAASAADECLRRPGEEALPFVTAELAQALACGLVYVGDQIAAAVERPSAQQVVLPTLEAVVAWSGMGEEPARSEREAWFEAALRRIAEHEEHIGSGPPDDEMREIAITALRGGSDGSAGE